MFWGFLYEAFPQTAALLDDHLQAINIPELQPVF